MHRTAPWGGPVFSLAALPWTAANWRFRSVQLGLVGHVGMLLLGWLMMTGIVFGGIPVAGGG